jgi:hypothetical protein
MKLTHTSAYNNGTLDIRIVVKDITLAEGGQLEARILAAVAVPTNTPQPTTPDRAPFTGLKLPAAEVVVRPVPQVKTNGAKPVPGMFNQRWNNDDDDLFIIEHYGQMKTAKIAARLGRTPMAVNARAGWLRAQGYPIPMLRPSISEGVKRSNAQREADKAAARSREVVADEQAYLPTLTPVEL